ncbi:MAG: hypothetical protein B6244_10995 [Candidatus Cloacimonetes bacterium 4572_55]|nr:MAG: hypothetical protein B6244_10995 [Candidatus Cloacimonetes bacterium 4572_55]
MKSLYVVIMSVIVLTLTQISAFAEWETVDSGVTDDLYGVFFINENLGFATGWRNNGPGGVILKTTNSGDNWTSSMPVPGSYIFGVSFTSDSKGFVAGSDAGNTFNAMILTTTDSGEEWSMSLFPSSYGFYLVDFPVRSVGYACGYLGIMKKTTNGGDTWTSISSGTSEVIRLMYFVDENIGYIVSGVNYYSPNKVRKTTDGGDSWSLVHDFGGSMGIGGIYFQDADRGVIAGNNGSEVVLKTTDGGNTWETTHTGPSSGAVQSLHFKENSGWAVGNSGRILHTTDYGDTWELDATVTPSSTTLLAVFQVQQTVYATGSSGRMFKKDLDGIGIEEPEHASVSPVLHQNHPNPFYTRTAISFSLADAERVHLSIYNTTGELVKSLAHDLFRAGDHEVSWDGSNEIGQRVAPGVYFYRIVTDRIDQSKCMVILK